MLPTLSFPSTNHSLQFSIVNLPSLHKSTTVRCHSATATSLVPPPEASLYEVLGVCWNASPSEIKVAYRRLAKSYHPDALSPSPEECDRRSFVEINRAYKTLSDSNARAVYDLSIGLGRTDATSFGSGCSSVIVGSSGFRVNPTRRWETDQCW